MNLVNLGVKRHRRSSTMMWVEAPYDKNNSGVAITFCFMYRPRGAAPIVCLLKVTVDKRVIYSFPRSAGFSRASDTTSNRWARTTTASGVRKETTYWIDEKGGPGIQDWRDRRRSGWENLEIGGLCIFPLNGCLVPVLSVLYEYAGWPETNPQEETGGG